MLICSMGKILSVQSRARWSLLLRCRLYQGARVFQCAALARRRFDGRWISCTTAC